MGQSTGTNPKLRWIIAAALGAMPFRAGGQQIPIIGETYAHDPSPVSVDGSKYFYYSTGQGILARNSTDLSHWSDGPAVFSSPPSWTTSAVPGFTGTFWAPDVAYFNSLYHMYYAVSTFGSQVSAIGMATSPTLNSSSPSYQWTDHGAVIQSNTSSPYNTIDPYVMTAPGGAMWMSFGSYWTGIYEIQTDPTTGMALAGATPVHLAQRSGSDTSDEASALYYRGGYYYLFSNWGSCCQGTASTYNVRMGRSASITGPYVDASGVPLLNGGGTLFLSARDTYIGPGQVGIITVNGQDLVSYHYYNGSNNGVAAFALQDLYWSTSGWPTTFEPLTWSANASGTSAVDGGGSWTLSQANFQYNSSANVWNNSGYGGVTFGNGSGAAGVVTLAQNVTAATITFNAAGSGNYNIAGGGHTINLSTGATITTNVNATVTAGITATALTTNGTATLNLSGPVTLTNFFARQGTVALLGTAALTTATSPLSSADNYSSIGQQAGDSATVTLSGNSSITIAGDFNVGDVSANGTLNIQGNAAVTARSFFVGKYGTSTGTVNQTGGAVQQANNGGTASDWRIGGGGSSSDSGALGLYNLTGGTFNTSTNFQVGAYGNGTFTQTAGTVTMGAYLSIGRFPGGVGLYNMSAGNGTLNSTVAALMIVGEQGTGTLKVGGSSTINANGLSVGHNNGALGTVIQTGGTINLGSNGLQFGPAASSTGSAATGSFTLSGGTLITSSIWQSSNSNVTGAFKFNGGTLEPLLNNSTLVPSGLRTFVVQTGSAIINTKGNNTSVIPVLAHDPALGAALDGGLIKAGAGTLTLASAPVYTGQTDITGGMLQFGSNSALISTSAFTIAGSNSAWTGTLDLENNDLDITTASLPLVTNEIATGFNQGQWNGTGIMSSTAAANTTHLTTVGVIQNNQSGSALFTAAHRFDGKTPGVSDVLLKYSYYGDANLDGQVDGSDYSRVDSGYLGYLTGWFNGDFNYDGVVNGSDYTLIDNAFNSQGAIITSQIPVAAMTTEISSVPEPAALAVIALAIMTQRRSKRATDTQANSGRESC